MSPSEHLRLDKWLWHARFFKSRTLAASMCATGRIRVNDVPIAKSHHAVRPGDVLTFALGPHIRLIRVRALGTRRGPASEAQTLYEDLAPPLHELAPPAAATDHLNAAPPERPAGAGRPTKADRRAIERLRGAD
ncbi:MAG: RNA-binding S4 domain-containing protein [Rhodospirillales bacterium]|nr:RNA-binding S4 domain-containing protein [Rhodospirillales bacterium]